jgi:hypothetical protein
MYVGWEMKDTLKCNTENNIEYEYRKVQTDLRSKCPEHTLLRGKAIGQCEIKIEAKHQEM